MYTSRCAVMIKSRFFLLSLSLTLLFFSCKKEQDSNFDCQIEGVGNIDAKVGDSRILNISVSKTQGPPENLVLSLKNVPQGVTYSFETSQGTPNFVTTLTISVNNEIKLGKHLMTLEAKSENMLKSINFDITVNDSITMTIKVYDGTKWNLDSPAGELCDLAVVKLYKDISSFVSGSPFYTTITDENGLANFYHVMPGFYFFTVEKGALSNIVSKKVVDGKIMGFATTNIDKYGQLQFRDENGDGKITDVDRVQYDRLILYEDFFSERVVWIGQ